MLESCLLITYRRAALILLGIYCGLLLTLETADLILDLFYDSGTEKAFILTFDEASSIRSIALSGR